MNLRLRTLLFGAVLSAQAVFILAWAGHSQWVLNTAPVVRLRPGPVDPSDPLRGDYATLNLEIARVTMPPEIESNSDVWVELVPDGNFYKAGRLRPAKAGEPKPDGLWAKAQATWIDGRTRQTRLELGIDKYFVEEGRGNLPRGGDVVVAACLRPSGRLYLKRVLVNGQPWR